MKNKQDKFRVHHKVYSANSDDEIHWLECEIVIKYVKARPEYRHNPNLAIKVTLEQYLTQPDPSIDIACQKNDSAMTVEVWEAVLTYVRESKAEWFAEFQEVFKHWQPFVEFVADASKGIYLEFKNYGEDYIFLGYKPYPAIVILNMGENFRKPFPRDYFGKELDEYPMMKGVINYSSCALIVNINATSGADYWINYANGRYKAPLALGVTAVMATDYYTFLASGQIFGLMGGLKGAAE